MTWREFANEVPTEARSVVVAGLDNGYWCYSAWACVAGTSVFHDKKHYWGHTDWNGVEPGKDAAKSWRDAATRNGVNYTHWCYIDPPGTEHPLAPLVSRLLSEWTRLHQPSTDWEVTGGRDALRGIIGVLARFLKVEMPKGGE
jgi:hypothetical protein